jgi:hypothetical protein
MPLTPMFLADRAQMNRSLSAVVKQRSRYYVPVRANAVPAVRIHPYRGDVV